MNNPKLPSLSLHLRSNLSRAHSHALHLRALSHNPNQSDLSRSLVPKISELVLSFSRFLQPVPGGSNSHAMPMRVDNHQAEVTDRIRSSNPTGPGVRMQFKSPTTGRNLSYDNPLEKNIANEAYLPPSTSFSGTSRRNPTKPLLPTEATNTGHGHGNKVGPSSSWIQSLQRISSAK